MIKLRAVERDDLALLKDMRNIPELKKYFREYRLLNDNHQEQWFDSLTNDRTQCMFCIDGGISETLYVGETNTGILKEDIELVGACSLNNISWTNRSAEFGIYIKPDKQGNGFAKEALTKLVEYGFNELNLHRIWGEVYSNNPAVDFYKKFGFKVEGRLKDSYYYYGWHDSIIIGLLKDYLL